MTPLPPEGDPVPVAPSPSPDAKEEPRSEPHARAGRRPHSLLRTRSDRDARATAPDNRRGPDGGPGAGGGGAASGGGSTRPPPALPSAAARLRPYLPAPPRVRPRPCNPGGRRRDHRARRTLAALLRTLHRPLHLRVPTLPQKSLSGLPSGAPVVEARDPWMDDRKRRF